MLTAERLRELLHYDPETGVFTWRVKRCGRWGIVPGTVAGSIGKTSSHPYVNINIDGTIYGAHRLAWLYTQGVWPPDQIDHINGAPTDNRLCNLRPATHAENMQNICKPHASTGVLGVSFCNTRGGYRAHLMINRKQHWLGRFDNIIDAVAARKRAERIHHPFRPQEPT